MTGLLPTVLACAVPATVLAQQPPVSSIRVTGDARVTAKPDRVQIDIGVTTRAQQSQEAAAQNARLVDAVLAAVRKAAGPTSTLSVTSAVTSSVPASTGVAGAAVAMARGAPP